MKPTPKLEQVIKILQEKGATDEQIGQVMAEVAKTAFAKMYAEAATVLSEADLKAIDQCTSQEEANFEIQTRLAEKTGKNPDEALQKYYDTFADKFLEEYEKEKATKP